MPPEFPSPEPIRDDDAVMAFLVAALRDRCGRVLIIPPPPGREPWNRPHAEPLESTPLPIPPAQLSPLPCFSVLPSHMPELAQSLVGLLQARRGEHGMVVSRNANLLKRLVPYIIKLLPDCTICVSDQTISLPDGSRIHFYQPHKARLAGGLAVAWLVAADSVPDQDLRRFVLCVRSRNYIPTFYRFCEM